MNLGKEDIVNAYNICGAPKLGTNDLDHFVDYFLNTQNPEWRFQGKLRFGGKLYHQYSRGFYVSCYKEDELDCGDMVKKTNKLLAEIVA